jgi:hypothetical protein
MKDDGLIILRNDESFWGLESALKVKTGRFFFWKFKDFEVVKLSWVTYPEKIKKVFWDGLIVMGNLPGWKTQGFFGDFLKWWKIRRFFKVVRNAKIFQSGFIVMGNRPKWKMKRVFKEVWLWWVTYPCEKNEMSWRNDMIGLKGTLFKRRELIWAFEKRYDLKGSEGWKAHSEGGRVRKHTT